MPTSGTFSDADCGTGGPYLVYRVESTVTWFSGVMEMPVAYTTGTTQATAGPGYTVPIDQRQRLAMAQTSCPYGTRLVTFDLLRWGDVPQKPDPTPGPNEVLKELQVTLTAPLIQPDGESYMQSCRGYYLYLLSKPPFPTTDALPGVSTAASTDYPEGNASEPADFSGLVDHTGPSGGDLWSG